MYYAAKNTYASATDIGFANTWYVLGFATKAMRDLHVKNASDLATRAITTREFKRYGAKHGQVDYFDSTGQKWVFDSMGYRGGVPREKAFFPDYYQFNFTTGVIKCTLEPYND